MSPNSTQSASFSCLISRPASCIRHGLSGGPRLTAPDLPVRTQRQPSQVCAPGSPWTGRPGGQVERHASHPHACTVPSQPSRPALRVAQNVVGHVDHPPSAPCLHLGHACRRRSPSTFSFRIASWSCSAYGPPPVCLFELCPSIASHSAFCEPGPDRFGTTALVFSPISSSSPHWLSVNVRAGRPNERVRDRRLETPRRRVPGSHTGAVPIRPTEPVDFVPTTGTRRRSGQPAQLSG